MNVAKDGQFKKVQGKAAMATLITPTCRSGLKKFMSLLAILYLYIYFNLWFIISVLHILARILNAVSMLTKTIKKCPSKSTKHHHRRHRVDHHHRRKLLSTVSMIAKINMSISTCRRNLIRFFSNITHVAADSNSRHIQKGFMSLRQESTCQHTIKFEFDNDVTHLRRHLLRDRDQERPLLPPMNPKRRLTVFLDLDETLVHACPDPPPKLYDFVVRPKISNRPMNFYVLKRPGLDKFLEEMSKMFEVVVFTAGVRPYAKLVLDHLDPEGILINHRLYRDSCRKGAQGKFIKDLSRTGRDLGKVVILDDNPNSYSLQPENAVPIDPFLGDVRDRELERLMGFFETCDLCEDMRDVVNAYFHRSFGHDLDNDGDLFEQKLIDV